MSIINAFPLNLQNGTIEDAAQVMSLFSWVQSQTNGGACPSTSGQIVLKGNGVGGTNPAVPDIDYASPASATPIGSIIDYGGTTLPSGYFPCDGRAISRTGYSLLFSKIGIIWGAGDGVTTFNIPNTGGRTAIFYGFGEGTGSGAGSGTVSSITVASANGFSGLVATPTTTAAITLSTTITGVLKGAAGALALALNSDLPVMSATVGGAVPTPPNLTTHYLRGDGTWVNPGFLPANNPTATGILSAPQVYVTDTTNSTSAITGSSRNAGGGSVAKDFWIGLDLHVGKDIYQQYSAPGSVIGSAVSNLDNTDINSGASVLISTGGASAGDPIVQYGIDGVTRWANGIDNSDGDKFKISNFVVLGTNDYLVIDPATGFVSMPVGVTNLIIGGTAQRIKSDFSNATVSNRTFAQTSTVNSQTIFGAIPNGTSTTSGFHANNTSDADNALVFMFSVTSTTCVINSFPRGTVVTPLPISIQMASVEKIGISAAGIVTLANITTPGGAAFHTTNTAMTNGAGASLGTLTNAPSAGNPTKWIGFNDNGTTRYIPAW